MPRQVLTMDITGPVRAEVFAVWWSDDHLELTGPCGPAPWLIELGASEHPTESVARIVADAIGQPLVIHSTSWRRDGEAVVLSFVAVIGADQVGTMESRPVARGQLARGGATSAPGAVDPTQVLEHGLRHLAWLAQDDEVVAAALPGAWRSALVGYRPEPFRNLG